MNIELKDIKEALGHMQLLNRISLENASVFYDVLNLAQEIADKRCALDFEREEANHNAAMDSIRRS